MKRVLSLVLALSMVFSMFTFSFAGSALKDIAGTEYEAAVDALVELGVVTGYTDGTYLPEKTVSRAEMASLLVKAAGLEPAAEVAEGATRFSDVDGSHWASGYINVASEYGYIAGYPDGTFLPNRQVSYAEAATMALRVLGYKTVVESKGTWPTNYIAKAQDLEMLEDISYAKYTDGAIRGNVAKLVWNMLKTKMWDITGESEGDGLFSEADRIMLNVKFPDYSYSYAEFESFSINGDGEVIVKFNDDYNKKYEGELAAPDYEYVGNDFYTFVKGTEVEVLVNEEDGTLLTMVATGRDKLVDGSKLDIDDEYDALSGDNYSYAYTIIEKKDVAEATKLNVTSEYIYEVTSKEDKYVKLNATRYNDKDYDTAIVLIDGERATLRDVEEGSVLSVVTVGNEEFFMVSTATAEGKLSKYVIKEMANGTEYGVLTASSEEYILANGATYVEDPTDEDEEKGTKFATSSELGKGMKGEEVVLHLDVLGRVARIDFDGSIDDESTEVKFFAVKEEVEKEGVGKYVVTLENELGEDTYSFEKNNQQAKEIYSSDTPWAGAFVAVTFNEDGEIEKLDRIARKTDTIEATRASEIPYGEGEKEYYKLTMVSDASYDDEEEAIVVNGNKVISVADDVVVVSVVCDDKSTDKKSDDESYVIFEEGLEAVANVSKETVIVIYDFDSEFKYAEYVVRFDDNTTREDNLVGKLEEARENKLGEYALTIDGEEYTFRTADNKDVDITKYENGVIVYSIKENNDEEYVTFISGITVDELVDDSAATDYVTAVDGSNVAFEVAGTENFKKAFKDQYDGYLFVNVSVDPDESDDDKVLSVEDPVDAEDVSASNFDKADRLYMEASGEVVYVVSGLEEREKASEEVSGETSGEVSGDVSGDKSGDVSGDKSGDKAVLVLAPATTTIESGESVTLTVITSGEVADGVDTTLLWTSSNEAVATVDALGEVTGVGSGEVTITATLSGDAEVKGTATITVTEPAPVVVPVTSVTINSGDTPVTTATVESGDTLQLTAVVAPEDATDKTVTWTSSVEAVATVSANGLVTTLTSGDTIITATASGDVKAELTLTVTAQP